DVPVLLVRLVAEVRDVLERVMQRTVDPKRTRHVALDVDLDGGARPGRVAVVDTDRAAVARRLEPRARERLRFAAGQQLARVRERGRRGARMRRGRESNRERGEHAERERLSSVEEGDAFHDSLLLWLGDQSEPFGDQKKLRM